MVALDVLGDARLISSTVESGIGGLRPPGA